MKEQIRKPQNPLAFASQSMTADGTDGDKQDGMTLRDYFAAKAISSTNMVEISQGWETEVARRAYLLADAMLKQREL